MLNCEVEMDRMEGLEQEEEQVLEKGMPPKPKYRETPRLPGAKDVDPAPATLMYWSKAPVYGFMPTHGLRAHTATLVDNVAWIFGGCDDRDIWLDVLCLDTGKFSSFSSL